MMNFFKRGSESSNELGLDLAFRTIVTLILLSLLFVAALYYGVINP